MLATSFNSNTDFHHGQRFPDNQNENSNLETQNSNPVNCPNEIKEQVANYCVVSVNNNFFHQIQLPSPLPFSDNSSLNKKRRFGTQSNFIVHEFTSPRQRKTSATGPLLEKKKKKQRIEQLENNLHNSVLPSPISPVSSSCPNLLIQHMTSLKNTVKENCPPPSSDLLVQMSEPPKRKRGRPKKNTSLTHFMISEATPSTPTILKQVEEEKKISFSSHPTSPLGDAISSLKESVKNDKSDATSIIAASPIIGSLSSPSMTVKRKRGRPPKSHAVPSSTLTQPKKPKIKVNPSSPAKVTWNDIISETSESFSSESEEEALLSDRETDKDKPFPKPASVHEIILWNPVMNPLPGFIDAITCTEVVRPAISPYGHVLSYSTWLKCLCSSDLSLRNQCPFTKQPLNKRQLILLTFDNIEQFKPLIRKDDQ